MVVVGLVSTARQSMRRMSQTVAESVVQDIEREYSDGR